MHRENVPPTRFQRLMNASWPVFRAFGVEVRVHWLGALVPFAFLFVFTAGGWDAREAALWALIVTVGLYVSVWAHEMGHVLTSRKFGVASRVITLSPLGGLTHFESPMPDPRAEIWTALAGPATQAVIALALGVPFFLLDIGAKPTGIGDEWKLVYAGFFAYQVALVALNLLPSYPMDGGRVLRGFLARRMHPAKASLFTAQIGYAGGITLTLLGLGAVFGWGAEHAVAKYGGSLAAWIGVANFFACRRLQSESQHAEISNDLPETKRGHSSEPWRDSLAESERLSRDEERRERREAETRRREDEVRRKLQERIDQLLDRINELGGVEKLPASERRELAEASELLRRETA